METEKKKRSFPLAFRRTKHRRQKSAPSNAINPVCDITGIEEEIASGGSSELGGSPRPVSPIQMHEVDRHIAAGSDLHVQVGHQLWVPANSMVVRLFEVDARVQCTSWHLSMELMLLCFCNDSHSPVHCDFFEVSWNVQM